MHNLCRGVDIEQAINTSKGEIAYTVIDMTKVEADANGLQVRLWYEA